jgi:hypothetical protein
VFGATETSFVGVKVNPGGIHTEDRMIAAIIDWPVPASTAQLRMFLGLAGYYRKFVHKLGHRTTQLYALTADKSAFRWLRKHQAEFHDSRRALVADALSRIHHPVSTVLAATISINTMALQIIGVEEWK